MARIQQIQTSLTSGMLDPAMAGRSDIKHYYSGAARIENMELLPQGGGRARFGLEFVTTLTGITDGGQESVVMAELRFNRDQSYLVMLTHQQMRIWRQGALVATIAVPWTAAELADLTWTRAADTMLFFHRDHRPKRLVRQGSHTSWSFDDMPIEVYPTKAFATTNQGTGTATPDYHTGYTSINSTAADFTDVQPGWVVRLRSGALRVNKVDSATKVSGHVMADFPKDGTTVQSADPGDWTIEEPLWSLSRGWPGAGTFFADRLYLGGSTQAPDTVAASKAGQYYTFDEGEGLDDEAVVWNANSDEINRITQLYGGNHLLEFTEGGEFAVLDFPVTPSNVSAMPQSQHGATNLPPVMIEDGLLFVTAQREDEHQAVMETLYTEAAQKYTAQDISLLASTVIRNPVSMALRKGNDETRAYHVFLVNADGTCAVLNTLRSQDVTGWSLWTTDGAFVRACVVGATVWFVTRRTINGATVYSLERLATGARTDCHKVVTLAAAAETVGGFDHLAGATVRLWLDGNRENMTTVAADGTIALPYPAITVEAGLPFEWIVEPMPFAVDLPDGTAVDRIKRVVAVTVRVRNAVDVNVRGRPIPFRTLGNDLLDAPSHPFTGTRRVTLLGYDREGVARISGEGPATLLGFMREVTT